jgi:ubiquinone/menaquinone biosynthesis C-methylase UbiE
VDGDELIAGSDRVEHLDLATPAIGSLGRLRRDDHPPRLPGGYSGRVVAGVERGHPAYAGQAVYTRRFLGVYDAVVLGFNSRVFWRCPMARLVELYNKHVSGRHLDIGVGTGRLLDDCSFPVKPPSITLMDLNRDPLEVAAARLERYAPELHQANVLERWDLPPGSFDSVAMSLLLHCLPGRMPDKTVVFEHARTALAPRGVLFGATVLADGVHHTPLSRLAMTALNRREDFSNLNDTLDDLDAGLTRTFESHEIQVQGAVAIFAAHAPA